MPSFSLPLVNSSQILNGVGLVLQYSLLGFIYYFIYRMVRFGYADLSRSSAAAKAEETVGLGGARLRVLETGEESIPESDYLIGDQISIGRSLNHTIVLTNAFVSYDHAIIERRKNHYVLSDLNSTNGTFVNGDKIQGDYRLEQGDEIRIGIVTFRFER
ncbi:MAG: FHA domain-containing protein [Sporomusaceae bacterium]|nr:FHA domain-containing protein [Sporomusaceae bacterium]